jgi:predicted dinucleotide-binding enzyme
MIEGWTAFMDIAIIGAGNLGTGLAKRLLGKGHDVVLSYSRDMSKLEATARSLGARAGTVVDAVSLAKVIVLATPYTASAAALKQAGNFLHDKIIWDCTNPLKPDLSGLLIGTNTSAGEENAALAPSAHIVKAIPPFAELLHSDTIDVGGGPPGVFVCGDDESSCQIVANLVKDIGAEPITVGKLVLSRYVEPANMLLVALAYANGFGPRIALSLRRRSNAAFDRSSSSVKGRV